MPKHQVHLADTSIDDANLCPVCNESLSAEYRIAGEKPLVVGECGHEVHYVSDNTLSSWAIKLIRLGLL
jgi:hypothetical protein